MTIGAYWLLAVFLYSYFVLVPSLLPEARAAAQARLLYFVQFNRLLLLAGAGRGGVVRARRPTGAPPI